MKLPPLSPIQLSHISSLNLFSSHIKASSVQWWEAFQREEIFGLLEVSPEMVSWMSDDLGPAQSPPDRPLILDISQHQRTQGIVSFCYFWGLSFYQISLGVMAYVLSIRSILRVFYHISTTHKYLFMKQQLNSVQLKLFPPKKTHAVYVTTVDVKCGVKPS